MIELLPAYGRDYLNKKEIINALNSNLDFLESFSLKPINKQQFKDFKLDTILVRYKNHTKLAFINIKKDLKND
tara:strand:+ start:909 stop:1127 length:219 start_codon:yes stop_codon:yes gene_type:complete